MFIFDWLKTGVSWVLVQFHQFFSNFMDPASGWTWTLSIVGLVIVIRILLIPLFVKQIKSQRNLQLIQPQIKEIQKKYKGDKEKQSQEMMKIYKETGTNPLASCLPILLQAPIFFALFSVLQSIAMYNANDSTYTAQGVFLWDQYKDLLPLVKKARKEGRKTLVELPAQPSPRWIKFFKSIGLDDLCFHCTRVTVVTRLCEAGFSESQTMSYVGHTSELVHAVYRKMRPTAVAKLGDVL